jgi:hypothetical protein
VSTLAARARAEHYAYFAPAGAEVKISTEDHETIAQVTIAGADEWVCITIGDRGTGRTTASAIISAWNGEPRKILNRDIYSTLKGLRTKPVTTTQTIELGPDELDQIRPGDRITAVNGILIPRGPVIVTRALSVLSTGSTPSIGIRTAHHTPANLYPDSTIDRGLTVERDVVVAPQPTPAPAAPAAPQPRTITRTVNGVKLHSDGQGGWFTSDRRFEIRLGYGGTTECEADHPVRLTPDLIKQAQNNPATVWAQPILEAVREGKRGYQCPGGSEHTYNAWQVWDLKRGDYALNGDLSYCESWADAAEMLTEAIASGEV